MFDFRNNLVDNGTSRSVDSLFSATAGERSKERLLPPDGFFTRAFVPYVIAHGKKERVGFVITASKAEEERSKDAKCHHR